MNIEKEVFQKYKVDYSKLEEFGFKKELDNYIYTKNFLDNDFKCIVTIDKLGNVQGQVIDLNTEEEYFNLRLETLGTYVNMIKEKYKEILIDIRNNCFEENYFVYDESNLICDFIYKTYGDKPEFLWDKELNGVFRSKLNNKWYAIIMNINGKYLGKTGNIEVMNVKIDENDLDNLLKEDNIYKAYHMNKKKWISILLNENDNLNRVEELIKNSHNLVNKERK